MMAWGSDYEGKEKWKKVEDKTAHGLRWCGSGGLVGRCRQGWPAKAPVALDGSTKVQKKELN